MMPHEAIYCSFCGECQYRVRRLIAGPHVFVCDVCVRLMAAILDTEDGKCIERPAAGESSVHFSTPSRQSRQQ